jgi:iron-sulfur cluster repair protein YtfE (RIC family)
LARANDRNGHGSNASSNGIRVRDRLCQLIRQHKLDAELVKSYAVDFCGTKTLREASREQVEAFVAHLADWAVKDRNALLCQLNSFQRLQEPASHPQAGAA